MMDDNVLADLAYRQGSLCEIYGHTWQPTDTPGTYRCAICNHEGYCPGCLSVIPQGAQTMRCEQHRRSRQDL
jgi:hypothetical protein